ncbi:unnamed protein product [Lampetra planeri]
MKITTCLVPESRPARSGRDGVRVARRLRQTEGGTRGLEYGTRGLEFVTRGLEFGTPLAQCPRLGLQVNGASCVTATTTASVGSGVGAGKPCPVQPDPAQTRLTPAPTQTHQAHQGPLCPVRLHCVASDVVR